VKRRLFNVLAGVSLVLCVMTAVLWIRSQWICDCFRFAWRASPISESYARNWPPERKLRRDFVAFYPLGSSIDVDVGDASGGCVRTFPLGLADILTLATKDYFPEQLSIWNQLGFWAGAGTSYDGGNGGRIRDLYIGIPFWLTLLVTAVIPMRRFYVFRRDRRLPGFCVKCNYDLRATPDRCPECGSVPQKVSG
jgi:hypothetical protein